MPSSPSISDIVSFSRELRSAREFKSISLSEVERRTRLTREHLEALESAHWDRIPSGFLRGFVGLYADAVGMNRQKVLRDFDLLLNPEAKDTRARLVNSAPLISQPERVGLTRAKIAAGWFADLAAHTRLKPLFLAITILLVVAIPALIRRRSTPELPPALPFSSVVAEYRGRTHGPSTDFPLPDTLDLESGPLASKWAVFAGSQPGQLVYVRDDFRPRKIFHGSLDTVRIQYLRSALLISSPVGNGSVLIPRDSTRLDSFVSGSDIVFRIDMPEPRPPRPQDEPEITPNSH